MNDLKYAILEILYNRRPYRTEDKTDLMNLGIANPTEMRYAFEELEALKYVKVPPLTNHIELTPQGANAYESEKEIREKRACDDAQKASEQRANTAQIDRQQKKQFRHDFCIVIFTLLCSLAVEYFPELFQVFVSFFK